MTVGRSVSRSGRGASAGSASVAAARRRRRLGARPSAATPALVGRLLHGSQLQLVGHLTGDVLEADRGARDALEADAVERESRQLADLDLPLDERVGARVAVYTEQQELLALVVVTAVGVQHLRADT